jgi:hypothetical protein
MAREIQGAHVEIVDEPRREEIKPVRVSRAAVDTENRSSTSRPVVEVMQPQPPGLDEVALIGSWLEAALRPFNPLRYRLVTVMR